MAKILDKILPSPQKKLIRVRRDLQWVKTELAALPGQMQRKQQEKLDAYGNTLNKKLAKSAFDACDKGAYAAALAEALFGAGKNYRSLIYLTSGRGVGAGIYIDGEIYRGSYGSAGEIGLLRLPGGGRVEEIARPSAVAAEFSRLKGCATSFSEFLTAFRNGDPDAGHLARLNAEQLAFAAETAVNLFDPEAIVLGGRALEFGEQWFNCFKHVLELNSTSNAVGGRICVERSFFGSSGVAVGGAQVVLDRIIK